MALTVPFDLRQMFLGNKSITHKEFVSDGFYNTYEYTNNVSVRTLKLQEVIRSNGVYLRGDRRFNFSRSLVSSTPKLRDVFVYEGVNYTVVSVNTGELHDQYKTIARNFRLAYGLTDFITIKRRKKLAATDDAGRALFEEQILGVNIPARVQVQDFVRTETHGVDQLNKSYVIPVEEYPAGIDLDCLVVLQDGTELEITGINDVDSLAVLPTIEAEDNGSTVNG